MAVADLRVPGSSVCEDSAEGDVYFAPPSSAGSAQLAIRESVYAFATLTFHRIRVFFASYMGVAGSDSFEEIPVPTCLHGVWQAGTFHSEYGTNARASYLWSVYERARARGVWFK